MSLDSNRLAWSITQWWSQPDRISSPEQAQRKFAEIYHDYASYVEDVSGDGATTLTSADFEGPLDFRRSRSVEDFCRQVDAAFVAYWTGTVFATDILPPADPPCPNVGGTGEFSSESSSQVIEVTANEMYGKLLPILSQMAESADVRAREIAEAMDTITRSAITVLITGQDTGSPSTAPILNECGVF